VPWRRRSVNSWWRRSPDGASLGPNSVVELTLALHRVFESPKPCSGTPHQRTSQALTARVRGLRAAQVGGRMVIQMNESEHDFIGESMASTDSATPRHAEPCGAGHPGHVVVVVGDGALTEAWLTRRSTISDTEDARDHRGQRQRPVYDTVAAWRTPGAAAHVLNPSYHRRRTAIEFSRVPAATTDEADAASRRSEELVSPHLFEYWASSIRPIDGQHRDIERTLRQVQSSAGPSVVHVITTKARLRAAEEERSTICTA